MSSFNLVVLVGNIGSDIELKHSASGVAYVNFSLATNEKTKDSKRTEWHRISAFTQTAEYLAKYAQKGSTVIVKGKLQYNKFTKDGVETTTAGIVADNVSILNSSKNSETNQDMPKQGIPSTPQKEFANDEVPF